MLKIKFYDFQIIHYYYYVNNGLGEQVLWLAGWFEKSNLRLTKPCLDGAWTELDLGSTEPYSRILELF